MQVIPISLDIEINIPEQRNQEMSNYYRRTEDNSLPTYSSNRVTPFNWINGFTRLISKIFTSLRIE